MSDEKILSRIVYLNRVFLPLAEAKVSVLDRGFTFADGVYEVIPVFSGHIFRLDEHLQRLANSMTALNMRCDYSRDEYKDILWELLRRNPADGDRQLYLQMTRGVSERDHLYNEDITPTFFAMCKPINKRDLSGGVSAITHEDIRWQYCHIKSTALLASVLLKNLARDTTGCHEAILIRAGLVTEGASSNVFIVKSGVVKTPLKNNSVLPGITRDLIVELLRQTGGGCEETAITEPELRQADEIWITSSTIGVVPIVNLDGKPVGDGRSGHHWRQALEIYEHYKAHGPHVTEQDCVA